MSAYFEQMNQQIIICQRLLVAGCKDMSTADLLWLNALCAKYLQLSKTFHQYLLSKEVDKTAIEGNADIEMVYLCLSQIVTCIRHLERTIKLEISIGDHLKIARKHFTERLSWCMKRLKNALKQLQRKPLHQIDPTAVESNYVEMLDMLISQLAPFTDDVYKTQENTTEKDIESAIIMCEEIRIFVDYVLSFTLSFANVALNQDKKALSAFCQKVMREYQTLAAECELHREKGAINYSNRKLIALALETAIYQMEDCVNEALLRLVFTCFLDYNKLSVEYLRQEIQQAAADDANLDLLIADFDINMDRSRQMGLFAVAYAPNSKLKTTVRSCLASFESLEIALIPTLRAAQATTDADLLEQHYNEEVAQFKSAIQQIVDSHAFAACYYELLAECLHETSKKFNVSELQNVAQMGSFVEELLLLPSNMQEIKAVGDCLKYFQQFCMMLRECRAILLCAAQVEQQRIIKRFKILHTVLRKLLEAMGTSVCAGNTAEAVFEFESDKISVATEQQLQASIMNNTSFYKQDGATPLRLRLSSASLIGQYSKILESKQKQLQSAQSQSEGNLIQRSSMETPQQRRCNMRRRESMRTCLLKRQKLSLDTVKIEHVNAENHINDIVEELNDLSLNISHVLKDADELQDDIILNNISENTIFINVVETI